MTGGWSDADAADLREQLGRDDLPGELRLASFIDAVRLHALFCTWDYETSAEILSRLAADGTSLTTAYQEAVNNHDGELGAAISALDPYEVRDLKPDELWIALAALEEDENAL